MNMQKGFTLLELMMVVAVIAILASVALPNYSDYVTRGKLIEATSALSDGRIRMENYYSDNIPHTYVGAEVRCPAATTHFTYACNPTATTYLITATGRGNLSDFVYTINQANAQQTTGLKQSWISVALPAPCWITKSGGKC